MPKTLPPEPALLKRDQLSARIGLSRRAIQRLSVSNRIPTVRISSKMYRYHLESVILALNSLDADSLNHKEGYLK